jgi:hypothetical protein
MATLGNTGVGGTLDTQADSAAVALGPFTAPESGAIQSVSVYTKDAVNVTVGVYTDTAGVPDALVAASSGGLALVNDWTTQAVSGSLTNGQSYWVVIRQSGSLGLVYSGGSGALKFSGPGTGYADGVLPNPFGSVLGTESSRDFSAYITYTPRTCGGGTWALIDSALGYAQDGGFAATTPAFDTTGANLFIASLVGGAGGVTALRLVDSESNIWVPLSDVHLVGPELFQQLFYCVNPTTGAAQTFTGDDIASGQCYPSLEVQAWSGADTTPFDGFVSAKNNIDTAAIQPGSLSAPCANMLFVTGILINGNDGGSTIDSSFAISDQVAQNTPGGANYGSAMAYKVSSSSENPTWTNSPAGNNYLLASMATFYVGAGGGGGSTSPWHLYRQMRQN